MTLLKCSTSISEKTLDLIHWKAKRIGHCKAVREVLDLPIFPQQELKKWALINFIDLSTGTSDQHFIERCWVCAYGTLMKIDFYFPHIDPYILKNPVP